MAICPRCGVESETERCPLCGERTSLTLAGSLEAEGRNGRPVPVEDEIAASPDAAEMADQVRLRAARDASAWEFSTVTAFIVSTVLLLTAWATDGFDWVWYPLSSIVFLWSCASALLGLKRLKPLMYLVLALAPPALLLAIDAADGSINWFFDLGFKLAVSVETVIGLVAFAVSLLKTRGLNVFGIVLAGVAAMLVGIESSIDLYVAGEVWLNWSNITGICLLPIAAFVFYVYYRVSKKASLKKLFHL